MLNTNAEVLLVSKNISVLEKLTKVRHREASIHYSMVTNHGRKPSKVSNIVSTYFERYLVNMTICTRYTVQNTIVIRYLEKISNPEIQSVATYRIIRSKAVMPLFVSQRFEYDVIQTDPAKRHLCYELATS